MHATCSSCAQPLVFDDHQIPDHPFSVRCPRCQAVIEFPGRSAMGGGAVAPSPSGPAGGGSPRESMETLLR
ncbi:MAG: zinc-ribbon domain-containing protein, partial [Acidobacteria bacterium]|nr:zinc-ribbon domain-containing protein [Acidobacteriota bacterium]